jgi:long-chain acyl-CoA synthetase
MLYDCWRRVWENDPNRTALVDLSTGGRWSFRELARTAEQQPMASGATIFPQGHSVEFILAVLAGWRAGRVICPIEPGQQPPVLKGSVPEKVVHLKTTSASTEAPRMIAFTASQLMADAENIVQSMGLRPEWPNLGLISLAHSYGFSNLITPLLLHGIPLVLAGGALPENVRRAAKEHAEVTVAAVPALWRTWLDADAVPENVRLGISAGAPLPLEIEQGVFERYGMKIHNFYGSSECGGIAYDTSEEPRMEVACVGSPLKNVQVSTGEEGLIEVRSHAVGLAYWPKPRPNLGSGLFRTTDLGQVENGLVFLRGRATDQINIAGRKVLPEVIEKVLATHPQVQACLAFGIPGGDSQRGETIVACIACRGGLNSETLKKFALERLPAWQVPRDWWFVEGLEPNHRGKLSRAAWRKRYIERETACQK